MHWAHPPRSANAQNGENAYFVMKYPRASGALRQAPDPMLKRARFACTTLLCTVGNLGLSRSGPPPHDQILDPPLNWCCHSNLLVLSLKEILSIFPNTDCYMFTCYFQFLMQLYHRTQVCQSLGLDMRWLHKVQMERRLFCVLVFLH